MTRQLGENLYTGTSGYFDDYAGCRKILSTKPNNTRPQLQRFYISIRIGPTHALRFVFPCEYNINWT
jgi:hypothetical protein